LLLVSDLLKKSPDLVSQFKNFYGKSALDKEEMKSERLLRASSNDTIVQNNAIDREINANSGEQEPLLRNDYSGDIQNDGEFGVVQHDPEFGRVVQSRRWFYAKVTAFVVIVLAIVSLSAAAVYYDWIKLLRQ
jgi:hypothetical protein